MAPDMKKIAADCWRTGSQAMAKENWDYAIEMFGRAVSMVPDNLMYRQSLRGVEYRKYNNNMTGAKMASMKLMGVRTKIKKARMSKDWQGLERAAEEGLAVNPWDAGLNADLGEACRNLGFEEVAVFAYQRAVESDRENKEFNVSLAELYEERGEYTEAIKVWQRVQKIDPLDGDARSKVTQLQGQVALDRGGYAGKGDSDGGLDDQEVARRLGRNTSGTVDGPGMSEEADLQRAIRKEPENAANYLKLADYYRRQRDLEKAAEIYQQAVEVSGGDVNIREQLEDVQLDILRHNLELAKEAVANNGEDDTAKRNAAALAREVLQREIEVLSSRVERYPSDQRLKFDLGQRFMRAKKYAEAIPLFQQSVNDQRLSADALVALGECFIHEKKGGLAKRQLEKAAPKIDKLDKPDLFKKTHYYLGRLCEEGNETAAAEDHYNEILEIDYNYRDTLQRLEKLQESGS